MNRIQTLLLCLIVIMIGPTLKAQKIKWILEPIADTVSEQSASTENFLFKANGKTGYFKGTKVFIQPEYDDIRLNHDYKWTYAARNGKKWGLINTEESNKVKLKFIYDSIAFEKYMMATVYKGGKYALYHVAQLEWVSKFVTIGSEPIMLEQNSQVIYEIPLPSIRNREYTQEDMPVNETEDWPGNEELKYRNILPKGARIDPFSHGNFATFRLNMNKGMLKLHPPKVIVPAHYANVYLEGAYLVAEDRNKYRIVADTTDGKFFTDYFLVCMAAAYGVDPDNYVLGLNKEAKMGLYSRDYKVLVPFQYKLIIKSPNNYIYYCKDGGNITVFNIVENKIITGVFDSVIYASIMANPIIVQKKKSIYNYFPKTREMVKLPFSTISEAPVDCYAIAQISKNKQRLFNINTQMFVSNKYKSVRTLYSHNLYTPLSMKEIPNLRRSPSFISFIVSDGKYCGIINKEGKEIIPIVYDSIIQLSRWNAGSFYYYFVLYKDGSGSIYKQNEAKIIESDIKAIQHTVRANVPEPDFWLNKNGKWALLSLEPYFQTQAIYDTFFALNQTYVVKEKDRYKFFFNNHLREYMAGHNGGYDSIGAWENGLIRTYNKGRMGLIIDTTVLRCIYDSIVYYKPYPELRALILLKTGHKMGILKDPYQYTPVAFDNIVLNKNYLWARYNGKWGILKFSY